MIAFVEMEAQTRFSRQQGLAGWDQRRLREAKCLVVGAGAIGNELLKNLALLGVGVLGIIDFDVVEESNLPRCTLFRQEDIGRPKAVVAQEHLSAMAPELRCVAYHADVLKEIGAGVLQDYDLVLGAVDSVAARWQINRLARRAGVSWIDAGVDGFSGQVTHFDVAEGACYECGMTGMMWQNIFERHSCAAPGDARTPRPMVSVALPIVSITAALQAQEAVRALMSGPAAGTSSLRPGERLSISLMPYELLRLQGRRRLSCLAHAGDASAAISSAITCRDTAATLLQSVRASTLQLEWDVVHALRCTQCGPQHCALPAWQLQRSMLPCPVCGEMRSTELTNRIALHDRLSGCTLQELGVPAKAHLQLLLNEEDVSCWYKIL